MKRYFILFFLFFVVATTFILHHRAEGETPLLKRFDEKMKTTRMLTYHDSTFGYAIRYPSFFEQLPDSLIGQDGCCQFRFWNEVQIVLSAFVEKNPGQLTIEEGMDSLATVLHATGKRHDKVSFTLSGPLFVNGSEMEGYRFYAKYVQHRKIWFVQSLTYPDKCASSVTRLIRQIDDWQVWENCVVHESFILHKRPQATGYRRLQN